MKKKIVENIQPQYGLSRDFKLAYGNLSNYLERIRDRDSARTRHLAKRAFIHRQIPRYDEFFNEDTYLNVITEKNKIYVYKINSYIERLNLIRLSETLDFKELSEIEHALNELLK